MPQSYNRSPEIANAIDGWFYGEDGGTGQMVPYLRYTTPGAPRVRTRSFSGTRIPDYREFRAANGYLPTTAMTDLVIEADAVPVYREAYKAPGRVKQSETNVATLGLLIVPIAPQRLADEAWSKLRGKVLDQDFNAPVFLAEASKTVDMVFGKVQQLHRAYRAFRRGRFDTARTVLGINNSRGLSNNWLEYKYGWMPVLQDIHGAAKTLADIRYKPRQNYFSASAKSSDLWGRAGMSGAIQHKAKVWCRVSVNTPSLQLGNKIGLLNPLTVAWELVPFSFVADWFVNIGDCIAEATAFSGLTILDGGTLRVSDTVGVCIEENPSPFTIPAKTQFKQRRAVREPGVQTMPRLQLKSNPLNLSKITTATALLRQFAKF